ncbi:tRNA G18 (ribose-2'-O)-methylase SpoU [Homoserinimonas aerilata]|uniref:tRNA G18 (Ribose-2'-O)-methylase SpoU n=1 Tax=Homoserinimonas aerilata TaxID=1162970 RepID=A0A542YIZ9_9MICO|nr:RNA methyltransferase [Homoserinimonas aerilata]TQL48058.1 tRNA G18 (ribose-2'-O)-methylase SpoU [Homoserinimonas aerilata]
MRVERVTDLEVEGLADYARLTDVVLRRLSEPAGGLYIAESVKVIARALEAGHRPRSFLVLEKWLDDLAPLAERFDVPVFIGEDELLSGLTGFSLHRGALASMHRPPLRPFDELLEGATRVVVLEDLADHTNVGAVFRAAAGLGADAVLISPRCADPFYRRSVRVSMGTVLQVPWTRMPEWDEAGPVLSAHGFHIASLALSDDAVSLDDFAANAPDKVALVLGTEGDGLSRAALAAADTVVTIPMFGGVDSLNVAAAAAVAIWALRDPARAS